MLNRIKSNWSFEERERLNQNWTIIENYLSGLQGQINLLSGDVDVQGLINQINNILNQGNTVIDDLETALQGVTTVITNAQDATNGANTAAQNALDAITNIQNVINNFGSKGSYDNSVTYNKNNIVYYNDGCSYIYINDVPSVGNPPPIYPIVSNAHWHRLADKGANGDGAVSKVNGKEPNGVGEITLIPNDIGAASIENLTRLEEQVTTHLDNYDQQMPKKVNKGLSETISLTLESGWGGYLHVQKNDLNQVYLRGVVEVGDTAGGTVIAYLPPNHYPSVKKTVSGWRGSSAPYDSYLGIGLESTGAITLNVPLAQNIGTGDIIFINEIYQVEGLA